MAKSVPHDAKLCRLKLESFYLCINCKIFWSSLEYIYMYIPLTTVNTSSFRLYKLKAIYVWHRNNRLQQYRWVEIPRELKPCACTTDRQVKVRLIWISLDLIKNIITEYCKYKWSGPELIVLYLTIQIICLYKWYRGTVICIHCFGCILWHC